MRSTVAAILLMLLLPAAVFANGSTWASQTILDERSFTTVVGHALDRHAIRDRLAERATAIVLDKLNDVPGRTDQVLHDIFGLDVVPSRPQLESLLRPIFATALEAPAVRDERDRVVAATHRFVVSGASTPDALVSFRGTQVVVDLGPVIERLALTVDPRLSADGLADLTPGDASVELADAGGLRSVGSMLVVLDGTRTAVPIVLLAMIVLIVLLAHRRLRAVGLVGVTLLLAGVGCLTVAILAGRFAREISDETAVNQVAGDAYDAFASVLVVQSAGLVVAGALISLAVWVVRRRRPRQYGEIG
jgi:chromate transport protein ChrA